NRGYYARAAGLWAEALAADPTLAGGLRVRNRYTAARCAALAASGLGKDAPRTADPERSRLRAQALGWLRDELKVMEQLARSPVLNNRENALALLASWKQDADLARLRDPAALALLPDEDRQAWKSLWADVDVL